jgi:hypothetical protein
MSVYPDGISPVGLRKSGGQSGSFYRLGAPVFIANSCPHLKLRTFEAVKLNQSFLGGPG